MAAASKLAPALVGVMCVLAFGVAGTSLDTTVSTEPDEAIDVDYDAVPIGQDQGETIKQSVSGERTERQADSAGQKGDSSSGEPEESRGDETIPDPDRSAEGIGRGPDEPSLLDRLLWLLRELLAVVLPVLALVVSVGLLYRYRRRIAALLAGSGGTPEVVTDESSEPWEGVEPSTDVDRAWLDLVRRLELDRPRARTPAEVEAAAVRSGMDSAAVESLTRAFRDARYGGEELTDDRRRQVRRSAQRLGLGGGSP